MNSSQQQNRTELAHKDLRDISRGYSTIRVASSLFYFKHMTLADSLSLQDVYEESFQEACHNGLKTSEQLLDEARVMGAWTVQNEEKCKALSWQVDKSKEQAKKINDPNQKKSFLEQSIPPLENELKDLNQKREAVIRHSAEAYASMSKNKQFLSLSLFTDPEFQNGCDEEDTHTAMPFLNSCVDRIGSRRGLAAASFFTPFFQCYIIYRKEPSAIFQRTAFETTVYQRSLLDISASLYGKMSNHTIPDEIMKDPIKILDYNPDKKAENSNTSYGVDDLIQKSAKSGGKLTPQDLLS